MRASYITLSAYACPLATADQKLQASRNERASAMYQRCASDEDAAASPLLATAARSRKQARTVLSERKVVRPFAA